MGTATLVSVAAFGVTIVSILVAIGGRIGRMELRVDEMWRVFMQQPLGTPSRGRRRYDRTLLRVGAVDDRRQRTKSD